jgi:hypothetical protein
LDFSMGYSAYETDLPPPTGIGPYAAGYFTAYAIDNGTRDLPNGLNCLQLDILISSSSIRLLL